MLCILATYRRPFNISRIVRSALASGCVDRLVVSNHDPAVDISEWLDIRHPRLLIRSEESIKGCGHRWSVALSHPMPYVLVVDDDVFLRPDQFSAMIEHLKDHPSVPHGCYGSSAHDRHDRTYLEETDACVELLHRVYAVTRAHIQSFFRIVNLLRDEDRELAAEVMRIADDIVISSVGEASPLIHDIGTVDYCATSDLELYATCREPGFHDVRRTIQARLDVRLRTYGARSVVEAGTHVRQATAVPSGECRAE